MANTWASERNLPQSTVDAKDPRRSIYFVALYHQLHCLTVVRAALYHYEEGVKQTVEWPHMLHCLDSIRQALLCAADDTPLYSNGSAVYGDKQLHVCRD